MKKVEKVIILYQDLKGKILLKIIKNKLSKLRVKIYTCKL